MRRTSPLLLLMIGLLLSPACERKKNESHKIVPGLPVDTTEVVLPADALQQLILLKRDSMSTLVRVVNRLGISNVTYPELTFKGGATYLHTTSDSHYGDATFSFQFFDETGAQIDPISSSVSTTSLKTVTVHTTGGNHLFSYIENLVLTLDAAGDTTGKKRLTGLSVFDGSGHRINFTFPAPGAASNFEGLVDGTITGTGTTALGNPISAALTIKDDHSVDGTLTWDGQTGGIHLDDNGAGFIATPTARLLID